MIRKTEEEEDWQGYIKLCIQQFCDFYENLGTVKDDDELFITKAEEEEKGQRYIKVCIQQV